MAGVRNRRAIHWLRSQLPELVASGVITSDAARAIDRHYQQDQLRSNFAFALLAALGSALVAAGIILLIAHNWDELGRATRTTIAFLPLLIAQALVVFTLMRRNESRPWREAAAIFDVAAVATAISLISQTYQLQGTFADFMRTWLLLSIPIVYLLRTTLGAIAYVIGSALWLFARWGMLSSAGNPMLFWVLLMLVIPYVVIRFRRNRDSRETATLVIIVALAALFGVGATAEFAAANVGVIAYAGLSTAIYLCGIKLFPTATAIFVGQLRGAEVTWCVMCQLHSKLSTIATIPIVIPPRTASGCKRPGGCRSSAPSCGPLPMCADFQTKVSKAHLARSRLPP